MKHDDDMKSQKFITKLILFAASLAFISMITSPQVGAGIILMLFIHEYSHLYVAKMLGYRTRGIYFLPMLGAVALMDEIGDKDIYDEGLIALAGPLSGLLYTYCMYFMYRLTGYHPFIAITIASGIINIFNLLPVGIMDGGRIIKSIFSCFGKHVMIGSLVCSLGFGAFIVVQTGLHALWLVLFFGAIEAMSLLTKDIGNRSTAFQSLVIFSGTVIVFFGLIGALACVLLLPLRDISIGESYLNRRSEIRNERTSQEIVVEKHQRKEIVLKNGHEG